MTAEATATTTPTLPTPTQQTNGALPHPPNFPVTWEHPDEARLFWLCDQLHVPDPATPADAVYFELAYRHGITAAARAYGLPFRCVTRRINTYCYFARAPEAGTPEDLAARQAQAEARIEDVMARLARVWSDEMLPEIQAYLVEWDRFDLQGATPAALAAQVDLCVERTKRLYDLHMRIAFPFLTAISAFDDYYRSLFADDGAFHAFALLQGFHNKTVESGLALFRLSRRALALPAVLRAIESPPVAEVMTALGESAEGRAFLADLEKYVDEYGQRGDRWGWSFPTWVEDPTPVIKNLKDYVAQPERDLEAEQQAQVAQRERLVAETLRRLDRHPPAVAERFRFLLKAAQEAVVLTEDHGFWIDFRCMYHVRRVFLELGRRFAAAGVLDNPDDVFLLTPDEMRVTAKALPRIDRRTLAATRRAEMEYFRTITPPPVLGTTPSGPPATDPLSVAIGKFFGAPPAPELDTRILRGSAGSPGVVRGRVRVIRSLADASSLRPGDVLVARMTAPPWTPLFATAAAIVTDSGGILSHSAIVAREYGIPAVVATGNGSTVLRDDQLVEVDGTAGLVRIL